MPFDATPVHPRAAEIEIVDAQGGGVHLEQVLVALAERHDVVQAMVEGGAALHGAFIELGLADRVQPEPVVPHAIIHVPVAVAVVAVQPTAAADAAYNAPVRTGRVQARAGRDRTRRCQKE